MISKGNAWKLVLLVGIVATIVLLGIRVHNLSRRGEIAIGGFEVQPTLRLEQLWSIATYHIASRSPTYDQESNRYNLMIDLYGLSEEDVRHRPDFGGSQLRRVRLSNVGRMYGGKASIFTMEARTLASDPDDVLDVRIGERVVGLTTLDSGWKTNLDRVDSSRWVRDDPSAKRSYPRELLRVFVASDREFGADGNVKWAWWDPTPLFVIHRFDQGNWHSSCAIWLADDVPDGAILFKLVKESGVVIYSIDAKSLIRRTGGQDETEDYRK